MPAAPADSMFALRDALYVTSDAWGKEELHGIPWQCGGDAVFTPAVPVAQECTVHFRLRSMGLPAGVGAAHGSAWPLRRSATTSEWR